MSEDELVKTARQAILDFDWSDYGLDEVSDADPEYADHLAKAVVDAIRAVPRWRPIDAQGSVAAAREPEPADDPDEMETGPEETNA